MQFSSVMPHFATQSSFFFSHSETLSPISNHLFRQRSLSLSFEVLQHQEASLLLFILTGQGDLTKVVDTWSFPNAYNIQPELSFFTFWNVVVQYLGRERPWSNSCPILLGCHLIYRNIKSIIMLHLLWNIYLCFDKITKNIWNTKYPQMWGENVRERNYQCSLGTLTISLPGLVQMGMRRLATCGGPETLSLIWLWAKKTLWIRHIPQSTRIIVPSRTSCTRSHSPRAALYILLLYQFIHSSLT